MKPVFRIFISIALASCLLSGCTAQTGVGLSGTSEGASPADISGVVTSTTGPEAGVWVIAQTSDLPTPFMKIVVTDDQGRYLIPDLPTARYNVWVRGYGLIDSQKVSASPGNRLDLRATIAPSAAAAAEYYPAIYWYSMLKIPEQTAFGPTGIREPHSQAEWLNVVKTNGCVTCHQLGNKATRTLPDAFAKIAPSTEAWTRRITSGQAMTQMVSSIGRLDAQHAFANFAEWTDRIARGELPSSTPSRPQGVERNIVISLWDWSNPTAYMHDEVSTDKRNPTVNAYGQIY